MNLKYEIEVKEKEFLIAQAKSKLKIAELSKKQFQNKVLVSGIILLVGIILFLIYLYLLKEKNNKILTEKNEKLIKLSSKHFINKKENAPEKLTIDNSLANRLIDMMEIEELYLDANITMTEIAGKLKVTSNRISKVVNSTFEKSFSDFVNEYRIKKAQILLADKNLKIDDISKQVGFNYRTTFSLVFKKNTGISPSVYRKYINKK